MSKADKAKLFIETPPEPVEKKITEKQAIRRSNNIWRYIDKHPGLNIKWLCKEIGYDRSNFVRYYDQKKKLPGHLIVKVEKVLEPYGLNVVPV